MCLPKSEDLVDGNGEIADAHAGRMKSCIGDGGRRADDTDLTHPFHTKRIEILLAFVDENDLDMRHVGMHRHVILGEVVIDDAAIAVIDNRLFV